jgi:hypothetical protein
MKAGQEGTGVERFCVVTAGWGQAACHRKHSGTVK